MSATMDRDCVIHKYIDHLLADEHLIQALPELMGKRLCCHCKADEGCHADFLVT